MMSSATDSSHKIEIETQNEEPAIQWPSECCIYNVPKRLRMVKKEAYTPKLISIGPIHFENPELKDMKMLKQRYYEKFFHRPEKAKKFESIIEKNEDRIRKCYAEEISTRGKEFVNMILLDSIFIIELFRMTDKWEDNENDYILSKPWLDEGIRYDLILLENQLPLFILIDLYSQVGDNKCFITLACNYFFPKHKELPTEMEGVKHFTDLHRNFYRPPPLDHLLDPKTDMDTAWLIFQKPKESQSEEKLLIEKRHLLNIALQKPWEIRPTSCLMNCFINFSGFKCLQTRLLVPQFVVDDGTEELFRNLMALEQCHYPSKAYICNYIVLLDHLINSKEDVELLVDKKVIVNSLGSNKAVAEMVNKLCLEIVEVYSYYRHIADDLNKLYDSRWNRNMASLINVYFRDIWRGTATVVGVFVLLITVLNFLKSFVFKNI
ncbi:UPF0481 protein At3g47200 [Quercus suber]|uniref:UPF0481 protein At3g47200 n=1 Tax=Quercus suber TaxID=58331 RepID=UPI0032DFFD1F